MAGGGVEHTTVEGLGFGNVSEAVEVSGAVEGLLDLLPGHFSVEVPSKFPWTAFFIGRIGGGREPGTDSRGG